MSKLLFLLIFPAILSGQEILIDSCGLDLSHRLNRHEALYFDATEHGVFELEGKMVAFRYGNFGSVDISKKEYFDRWGYTYFREGKQVSNQLVILTPEEKITSGGFDAVIISWSKFRINEKHRKKLVRRLNKIS